ncbi:MAG: RAMP superfamily protein [Chloroflexi bacterium]|nr:RAMP superfamily protein [Chloroflexota bacterium]
MGKFKESVWLKLTLLSDAAFGRGDGVAGLVDAEVLHDPFGLPYLGGKTLKGLLAAECAEILYALKQAGDAQMEAWEDAARFLFGSPGSKADTIGRMIVGNAQLPEDLRALIGADFRLLNEQEKGKRQRANLESLTTLRRQTAVDHKSGASKDNTLRTIRVIIRDSTFTARLDFSEPVSERACWLLAACVQAFHRAGTNRNRGYGRLHASLHHHPSATEPVTWFDDFAREVQA